MKTRLQQIGRTMICAFLGGAMASSILAETVKIEFVPPPMEGTISMGIYNQAGQLVRVLHREADLDEFKIALNGLVTEWDGLDDNGNPCPPGTYRARGYRVGDVKLEGVEIHGNDWITEEENAPRIRHVVAIKPHAGGKSGFLLEATGPGDAAPKTYQVIPKPEGDGSTEWVLAAPETKAPTEEKPPALVWTLRENGEIIATDSGGKVVHTLPAPEKGEGVWVPKQIAGANEQVFILEESGAGQRIRGLELRDTPDGKTEVVLFEKELLKCGTPEEAASLMRFPDGSPFMASPELQIRLVKNPLIKEKAPSVRVKVVVTPKGAEITTTDGLPLVRVSETEHLKWVVFGRPGKDGKTVTIFESDGAAVEEFRAENLAQMMSFDAGKFPLKKAEPPPAAPSPSVEPDPPAEPSPSAAE